MQLQDDPATVDPYRPRTGLRGPSNTTQPAPTDRWLNRIAVVVLCVGALFRIVQYAAGTSQWLDEILLSQSVVERPLSQLLTQPLEYGQTAPALVLVIEKVSSIVAGPTDRALRFGAFLASLAGLLAFYRASRRILRPTAVPIAAVFIATAVPLIIYSSQAKQYSFDVFASLVILVLAIDLVSENVEARTARRAAIVGAVLAWLSQPSLFVLGAMSGGIVLDGFYRSHASPDTRRLRRVLLVSLVWMISATAAAARSSHLLGPEQRQFMQQYWASGFVPLPFFRVDTLVWTVRSVGKLFGQGGPASLLYRYHTLYVALAAFGFGALLWRSITFGVMLLSPIVVAFLAAALHIYPFADRLVIFLLPFLFLAVAEGVAAVLDTTIRFTRAGLLVLVMLIPVVGPLVLTPPPYRTEDVRPVLEYVSARRQSGDTIYVFRGASFAIRYYGHSYGLFPNDLVIGSSHNCHTRGYFAEIDALRGRPRVWVIVVHGGIYNVRDHLLAYLNAVGRQVEGRVVLGRAPARADSWTGPAEAYLYDLGMSERTQQIRAATFPLVEWDPDSRFGCDAK